MSNREETSHGFDMKFEETEKLTSQRRITSGVRKNGNKMS